VLERLQSAFNSRNRSVCGESRSLRRHRGARMT
jgi:hypothetical protein